MSGGQVLVSAAFAPAVTSSIDSQPYLPYIDITDRVSAFQAARGRTKEIESIEAGTASLALDNSDGRFTPGRQYGAEMMPPNIATGGAALGAVDGWISGSGSSIVQYSSTTANPASGNGAIQVHVTTSSALYAPIVMTNTASSPSPTYQGNTPVVVKPNHTYLSSMWVRNTTTTGYATIAVTPVLYFYDALGKYLGYQNLSGSWPLPIGGSWQNMSFTFTAPANAHTAVQWLSNYTSGVETYLWIANWSMRPVAPYYPYVVPRTPLRIAVVQNGNLLPYSMLQDWGASESAVSIVWNDGATPVTSVASSSTYNANVASLHLKLADTTAHQAAGSTLTVTGMEPVPVLASTQYTAALMSNGPSAGSCTITTTVTWYDFYGEQISQSATSAASPASGTWLATSVTATSPTTAAMARVSCTITNVSLTAATYLTTAGWSMTAGSAVPAFAPGDGTLPIHSGYVEEWPTKVGNINNPLMQITSVDLFKLLGNKQIDSPMAYCCRSGNPVAYWTLSDPLGSTFSQNKGTGSAADMRLMAFGSSSSMTFEFGSDAGYGQDQLNGASLSLNEVSGATTAQGGVGYAAFADGVPFMQSSATGSYQIEFMFELNCSGWSTFPTYVPIVNYCGFQIGAGRADVYASGSASAYVLVAHNAPGDGSGNVSAVANTKIISDGNWHYAAFVVAPSGYGIGGAANGVSSITMKLCTDNGTWITANANTDLGHNVTSRVTVGAGLTPSNAWAVFSGKVSHVGLYPSTPVRGFLTPFFWGTTSVPSSSIATRYTCATTGWAGENEVTRLQRQCSWTGIPSRLQLFDPPISTLTAMTVSGSDMLTAFKDIGDSTAGIFFIDGRGRLVYHNRQRRTGGVGNSVASFGSSTGNEPDEGLEFTITEDEVVNDVEITINNGPQIQAANQASIASYGDLQDQVTVWLNTAAEAEQLAWWIVNRYSTPVVRMDEINWTLSVNSPLWSQLAQRELSDLITLTDLPDGAPMSSMQFFIERVAFKGSIQGGQLEGTATFRLSPMVRGWTFTTDSVTNGVLDSGAMLAY